MIGYLAYVQLLPAASLNHPHPLFETVFAYTRPASRPPLLSCMYTRRYLAYVQLLPAWQKVDYGSGVIIEDWERHP